MKNLRNTILTLTLAELSSTGLVAMKRPPDGDLFEAPAAKRQKMEDVILQGYQSLMNELKYPLILMYGC